MEDLNYLEYVRARAEEKLVVAENDARYQRAIVAAMDDKIAALKAQKEDRPHPQAKFRLGEKVRFTQEARDVKNWTRYPTRVTADVLAVLSYVREDGVAANWDTVCLSDNSTWSVRWLESAEAKIPETGYACPHWKPGVATLRDHCTACEAESRQK